MAERVCCSYQNVLSIQNRVCCLYRVSTTKQVDHDDQNQADIPVQRKACREFAERMGWTIVYEEQENGVSGFKVSASDRDKIQLIKEYAEQGKFDILLVFMFDRTVGHILHNIMYTGVLRSGSTQSKAFPDLQIISPENFELAQKLMAERANECNALRTMPRNTRGQSLLSGNVFCGHCGGRLTLTTNGTTRINAAGEKVGRKRIRYVCYNKTRKRSNCDGQTGYTMHILDKMVTDILHQVFDRMRSVEENEIISRTHRSAMVSLKKRLADAKAESAKATKEYESLKLEIIKAVQGESAFPMDILSELVNNARTRMLDANAQLTELNEEVEKSNQRIEAIKADYRRIMEWSEMFDGSDMDVKKMIAGYIIKRVDVYSDYRLHIEFNMSFAQFELGLETEVEYAAQDSVS